VYCRYFGRSDEVSATSGDRKAIREVNLGVYGASGDNLKIKLAHCYLLASAPTTNQNSAILGPPDWTVLLTVESFFDQFSTNFREPFCQE
jgi:hypothetical protein